MRRIGLMTPPGHVVRTVAEAMDAVVLTGYPAICRPSFTLGGSGGGIAYNREEFDALIRRGLELSPVGSVLVEKSVIGWKEFELEVMRDGADNVVIVCTIENLDPMGVHTGDSITVAPAMTLSDHEYQVMRDAAIKIIREVGVAAGGCNIQFAVSPTTGEQLVIEMNPRVSRSSALASKATGFPIARIGTKVAVGYRLDELPNDITKTTPASFEPVLDYVVVKIPRFAFEKFPTADPTLTTQMKSVGEVMAIGRTFKEALQKGFRGLEADRIGWMTAPTRSMTGSTTAISRRYAPRWAGRPRNASSKCAAPSKEGSVSTRSVTGAASTRGFLASCRTCSMRRRNGRRAPTGRTMPGSARRSGR
jgi:carbamoyl-phosphate synthase large subunit